METSFLELRNKEVINVLDGRLLGRIIDLVFDVRTSRILGFIVPGSKSFFSIFKSCSDIFIPYNNICKIGEDVILVEVFNIDHKDRKKKVAPCSTSATTQEATNEESLTKTQDDNFLNV